MGRWAGVDERFGPADPPRNGSQGDRGPPEEDRRERLPKALDQISFCIGPGSSQTQFFGMIPSMLY